jgi:RNA polymerase sigma factor (sigma-70 family)
MNDDATLLRRYVREGDETAFAELVGRHIHLVWGAARRVTGDGDLARDVAQTVFCDLARKARSLPENTVLVGWLHRAACHAAGKTVRGNARRAERERLAMNLQDPAGSAADARIAETLQPVVDEALAALSAEDRDAVLLRFFGKKSFAEVGVALGVSDDTAQKRVSRALDRLRDQFQARGLSVSAGAVAAAMNAAGAEVAPAFLSAGITATAVGSVSSVSWFASLALMKTPAIIATVAALGIAAAYQTHALGKARQENAAMLKQIEEGRSPAVSTIPPSAPISDPEKDAEILRLRAKVAELMRKPKSQAVASSPVKDAVSGNKIVTAGAAPNTSGAEEKFLARSASRINAGKNLGLDARVYSQQNQDILPTSFEQIREAAPLSFTGKYAGGMSIEQFEFFPQPRSISERESQLILFREKQMEFDLNAMPTRVYVFADGTV